MWFFSRKAKEMKLKKMISIFAPKATLFCLSFALAACGGERETEFAETEDAATSWSCGRGVYARSEAREIQGTYYLRGIVRTDFKKTAMHTKMLWKRPGESTWKLFFSKAEEIPGGWSQSRVHSKSVDRNLEYWLWVQYLDPCTGKYKTVETVVANAGGCPENKWEKVETGNWSGPHRSDAYCK